jgi:hypothetical protein
MDKSRVNSFLKSVGQDFKSIKFEETDTEVKLSIGNFFLKRNIDDDYDYAVKKLFEDFLRNTSSFYTNIFWEQ